jgi:biotin operon repressor
MRRADRLFDIIQVLRQASGPMTGDAIAEALETSRRTIYRDIATLISQRVPIRGEPGVGYILERGFDLPPLMLTVDEVEAATLGAQWVVAHADSGWRGRPWPSSPSSPRSFLTICARCSRTPQWERRPHGMITRRDSSTSLACASGAVSAVKSVSAIAMDMAL